MPQHPVHVIQLTQSNRAQVFGLRSRILMIAEP
jgi:hypothetical protein